MDPMSWRACLRAYPKETAGIPGIPKNRKPFRVTPGKGEVKYSLILECFYPKKIQIQWFYVLGEETQPRPSTEKYQTNMDKMFSVTTECKIPEKDVKKAKSKIRVTWSHESMDDPGSREMCIGDKDSLPDVMSGFRLQTLVSAYFA